MCCVFNLCSPIKLYDKIFSLNIQYLKFITCPNEKTKNIINNFSAATLNIFLKNIYKLARTSLFSATTNRLKADKILMIDSLRAYETVKACAKNTFFASCF